MVPTANIFDASSLAAWYELRVTLMDMGKRHLVLFNAHLAATFIIGIALAV